jgi:aspartate kinase
MSLLAMAIQKLGSPVISLTGWQAGLKTDATYSNARIDDIETARLQTEIDEGRIVIIAGFQGINKYDDITTLGRGGSDTTAVAFAAALNADLCQIYTDVDGVYTTDPRIVKNAKKLTEISYDEMLELASLGAQVLHNRSVEMAKRYNINLEVLSSFNNIPGTTVKEVIDVEKMLVRGVARDNDVARISIIGVPDEPGIAFKIFSLLARKKVNVDIILQSIGRDGTKDVSFTVNEGNLETAIKVLNENLVAFGARNLNFDKNISKVSIVGAGMSTNPGVASGMFEALYNAGINIQMISTSEIKISVLIEQSEAERAVKVIHEHFKLGV